MGDKLLLVGSVPLDTVEEVMQRFGGTLGRYLPALPDGEVGERRSWVNRLCYLIFNGHADLETLRRPKPVDGVEQLLPRTRDESWQFRVRPGVERVRFGNPGSRLGYARDAVSSYFVFRTLREKGIIPADLRFQISIPMVNSVVRPLYFVGARLKQRATCSEAGGFVRRLTTMAVRADSGSATSSGSTTGQFG